MNRKTRNITFIILGLTALYAILAIRMSNFYTDKYDFELNKKRKQLGLSIITDKWKLDSIEFIGYGNYSLNELENLSEWFVKLENEKLYCQHWNSYSTDTTLPYLKSKKIFFFKSIWFWKNKIHSEYDIYVNPKTEFEYNELLISYDYTKEKWFYRLDTLKTELKKQQEKARLDSIIGQAKKYNLPLCGPVFMDLEDNYYFDTIGLTKLQTEEILNSWNLK